MSASITRDVIAEQIDHGLPAPGCTSAESDALADAVWLVVGPLVDERDRYRLAWLSARRRDGENSLHATEALELKNQEIARLRAELAQLSDRESTRGTPRLQFMGTEEDGGTVYRLADGNSSTSE